MLTAGSLIGPRLLLQTTRVLKVRKVSIASSEANIVWEPHPERPRTASHCTSRQRAQEQRSRRGNRCDRVRVKNYLRVIYDKLGLWNRVELALWYEARRHEAALGLK